MSEQENLTKTDLLNTIEIIQHLQHTKDRSGFINIIKQKIMPLLNVNRFRSSFIKVDFSDITIRNLKNFVLVNYNEQEFDILEKFLPYWQGMASEYFHSAARRLVLADGVDLPAERFAQDKERFLDDHPEFDTTRYPCFHSVQWQIAFSDPPDYSMAIGFLRDKSVGSAFSFRESRIAGLLHGAVVSCLKSIALQEKLGTLADVVNFFIEQECPIVVTDEIHKIVVINELAKKLLNQKESDFLQPELREIALVHGDNSDLLIDNLHGNAMPNFYYKSENKFQIELTPLCFNEIKFNLIKFNRVIDKLTIVKEKLVHHGLTAREAEIAMLLFDGLPTKNISERLFISMNTLKTHIKRIHYKFGTSTRTQLVAKLLS
jgi:DNA-binding CsgD family transcriptional regulator